MDKDKRKLWIAGRFIEVTEAVYQVYMQGDRKMRYFETDLKIERTILDENGRIQRVIPSREDSLDRLVEDNARQFEDPRESVEDAVLRRLAEDDLRRALTKLTDEEYALLKTAYPFIRHIPMVIAMNISHVSGCAMMCGGKQRKPTQYFPACILAHGAVNSRL